MQTRSQTRIQTRIQAKYESSALYEVNIDFDGASAAWKSNKKAIGNGSYKYICCVLKANGEKCEIKCMPNNDCCKRHYTIQQREKK
jgi:hypothetical protein